MNTNNKNNLNDGTEDYNDWLKSNAKKLNEAAKDYNDWLKSTVNHWAEKMKLNPEATRPELKTVIKGLELNISDSENQLDEMIEDKYENRHHNIEYQQHLDAKRELLPKLQALLNRVDEIKPKDKEEWIQEEYKTHRDNYKTDTEWAESTAIKFKREFNTSKGDTVSMKRYGKYQGQN